MCLYLTTDWQDSFAKGPRYCLLDLNGQLYHLLNILQTWEMEE